jgi:hypothetical protein
MSKCETPKAGLAYRSGGMGKRLGVVYGETEEEALENAQKKSPRPRPRRSAST